ncbi:Ral guanine nucleotide dissociation stimulator-like 1 [Varanus komodoensis]|nr:Ral guanine nucleotide dissociation stimulator-like 1 [Varanus komodoensis]
MMYVTRILKQISTSQNCGTSLAPKKSRELFLNLTLVSRRFVQAFAKQPGNLGEHRPSPCVFPCSAIASILRAWLDQCAEDFQEPPQYFCLQKLLGYLTRTMPGSDPERRAQHLLEQFKEEERINDSGIHDTPAVEEEMEARGSEEFSSFPEDLVAEQLTYMDAKLFKRVVPHHCLGCIWSRRDKKENKHLAPTIRATIAQFNAVTKCVVRTILSGKELKSQQRAKIIEKWINIAHECRILKNFSSLRAIVSALQSNSIYRLKKCWASVAK